MKISKDMFKSTAKTVKSFIHRNAPQILAGVGITLSVGAVCEAVHATTKAVKAVDEEQEKHDEPLTKTEVVKTAWKYYVPTASLVAGSVGCVIGSVGISARRLATMGMAYAMSENSLKEYKDKAKELIGEKKEEEIRGAIAQDKINENPPDEKLVRRAIGGTTLCRDAMSGQYFYSDADTIKRAVMELNRALMLDYFVSLNDYYYALDLETAKFADDWGWNISDGDLIETEFTTELSPEGTPVLVVDFTVGPRPNFRSHNI